MLIRRPPNNARLISLAALCCLLLLPLALTAQKPEAADSAGGWRVQHSGVLNRLHAVFFADRQRGWAAGSNGMFLTTEDGGETWKRAVIAQRDVLRDVFFVDSERGFLLGEYSISNRRAEDIAPDRAFLMASNDAGRNWQPVELRNKDLDSSDQRQYNGNGLLRLVFADDRAGWAVGEAGIILSTRDSGQTWARQRTPTSKLFYDLVALDEQQAWAVGGGGAVIRTVDGGKNWNLQPSGATQTLHAVHFVDNRRGWAVGANGAIIATANGGNLWQPQVSGTDANLHSVFFTGKAEGWAAGERGTLLHTVDGGQKWEAVALRTRSHLTRLFFLAPDCGWAVGTNGAVFKYQGQVGGVQSAR
jgi:photosystem II stability/assembly factor-like uncharacterized protein